jgi:chemotaxis protein MotA
MRPITVLGATLIAVTVSIVLLVSPSNLLNLINIPGLLVVLGGTLIAVMLSKPQQQVVNLLKELPKIYKGEYSNPIRQADIQYLMRLAHLHRSGQLRALEQELKVIQQPLLRKGVQLILDRCTEKEIKQLLVRERNKLLFVNLDKARILRLMASYAPAFGMLGTLLGLIHMLYGLGDVAIETVGSTMGFALLTTLYGLIASNLMFKPLAIKLERSTTQHETQLNMLIEGVLMVFEKKHPLIISDMLESYRETSQAQLVTARKGFFAKMLPMVTANVD